MWISIYAHHATGETLVAEVAGRVPVLSRRLHERVGEDVRRPCELCAAMDPALCHGTLCQTGTRREGHRPRSRRDVALPQKTRHKLWIWKALDRDTGRLLDWECGRRDAATLKTLVDRLAPWDVTFYCTDHWPVYAAVIPPERLVMSKAHTDGIERNHGRQRHGFGRFKRRSIIVSQSKEMVDLTMALFARFRVNGDVTEIFVLDRIM
jgi:IS1 family transposase